MKHKFNEDIYAKAKAIVEEEEKIRQYKAACEVANICYVCGGYLKRNSLWNIFQRYLYCSKCNERCVEIRPFKC